MRLIDADAMIEHINKERERGFPVNENLSLYALSVIAHQPTAYDIDEIVKEIEAQIEFEFNWLRKVLYDGRHITLGNLDVAEKGIREIINIVKKGCAE